MIVEDEILAVLTAYDGLTDMVGDRFHPLVMPQGGEMPAVVFQKISAPRLHTHSGQSGLSNPRVQLACWGTSYVQAGDVAEQVRLAFATGKPGALVTDGPTVYDQQADLYRALVDVRLWHSEATA